LRPNSTEQLIQSYVSSRDEALREQIIDRHRAMVSSYARKFVRPGVAVDDLIQTGWVAFIGALDRFDPDRGNRFSTYAVHCIVGELKRYLRDKSWGIHVPRHLQEIYGRLGRLREHLQVELGREPTVREMAVALGIGEELLLQAMDAGQAHTLRSLDEEVCNERSGDSVRVRDSVGAPDQRLEAIVEHAPLRQAVAQLDRRDREILRLRYFLGFTQAQVARVLRVSQMHVSRLERRILTRLRSALTPGSVFLPRVGQVRP